MWISFIAIQILIILISNVNGVNLSKTIRLIQLGDWGGDQNANDGYATPAQVIDNSVTYAVTHSLSHSVSYSFTYTATLFISDSLTLVDSNC